jgi:hypothetical protein
MVRAIETHYAGYRFRSRLEARWAVFFDQAGIPWEYEPQGYLISRVNKPYLPDFRLPDCGTWIEVKGSASKLDLDLLEGAAMELPGNKGRGEQGPRLMLLGDIPQVIHVGDLGWTSLNQAWPDETQVDYRRFGFGCYHKNSRPWFHCNEESIGLGSGLLIPTIDPYEGNYLKEAYQIARAARFEHGETPVGR